MDTSHKPLNILGIIGIRSGSKGIPDKNIKSLAGKPLVGWIIEKAKQSKYLTRVVVSTDSPHYAEIARAHGAETPFLRPPELAGDSSPEFEYIKHALSWLKENEKYEPDIVVRLMATSPLQTAEDIDACIEKLLQDKGADTSVVVAEARQHPLKAFRAEGELLVPFFAKSTGEMISNRQDDKKAYFRANVVACPIKTILEKDSMYGARIVYHVIPQERAVDIDTPTDFFVAEQLMNTFKNSK